jgi:retron-type reverse transcriptase
MQAIEERVVDRNLLNMVRDMLRAGVMQDGAVTRRDAGTPQGGVISPLLANVYLHRLDRQWQTQGVGVLVRLRRRSRRDVREPPGSRSRPRGVDGDPRGHGP